MSSNNAEHLFSYKKSGSSQVEKDPWHDYASKVMPENLTDAVRFGEFYWNNNGTFRTACQRTVRYFITNLEVKGLSDDEKVKEIRNVFLKTFNIVEQVAQAGDTFMQTGNVFYRRSQPFDRYLQCTCGHTVPIARAQRDEAYQWSAKGFEMSRPCPNCGRHAVWDVKDIPSKDLSQVRVMPIPTLEIKIDESPYTGEREYVWQIPEELREAVKKGKILALRDTPKELLDAIMAGEKEFVFAKGLIFHYADASTIGIKTGGKGIPRILSNFRLAFHIQVLSYFDQCIAMNFIHGTRILAPDAGKGANGGDPLANFGGGAGFKKNLDNLVAAAKRDPGATHTAPFPIREIVLGADGTQISPIEYRKALEDELLNNSNIPAELHRGTLSVQSAPVALRVFENSWPELTSMMNAMLEWHAEYMQTVGDYPEFEISFLKAQYADDIERRAIILELMAGNRISPQTALETLGIDNPEEELRRNLGWEAMQAIAEKEHQEKMQQLVDAEEISAQWAQQSQGAPGPMDPSMVPPMGPGGGPPPPGDMSTPESANAEVDRQAQEIMVMEPSARRSALVDLKHADEQLHALVKQRITDMEQQAGQAGVQAARQGQM